ncbi:putative E3 ubiquitin-protein ligase DTX3 [Glandiceps talaboti]
MTCVTDKTIHLPGYEKKNTLIITYDFAGGVQEAGHPRPGQIHTGSVYKAYLPDIRDGQKLHKLLRKAFDQGLVFGILASESKDEACTIVWRDIVHKTSITGGPESNGYPDPDYLKRLREQLKVKGIK